GALDVNGDVTISTGTGGLTAPSGKFTVSGNWTKSGASTFTPGSNTVEFDGAGTQTLDSGTVSFSDITHSGTGTLQLANRLTVTSNFTNSAGTFDLGGSGKTWTMTGATFANHVGLNSGIVQLTGAETITGLTNDTAGGTWRYVGSSNVNIKDFGSTDYYNLEL